MRYLVYIYIYMSPIILYKIHITIYAESPKKMIEILDVIYRVII